MRRISELMALSEMLIGVVDRLVVVATNIRKKEDPKVPPPPYRRQLRALRQGNKHQLRI